MRSRQVTRFSIVRASAFSLLALTASLFGCSSAGDAQSVDAQEDAGSLGLSLLAAPGIAVPLINYSIQGTNGFTKSGVIIVSNSAVVSAVIGGIPAGTGYTITLFGTSTGFPNFTCSGAASFQVQARQTSSAAVSLLCRQAATTGSVAVSGSLATCPTIAELSVTPAEAKLGAAIVLTGSATDANSPDALSYQWLVTSGSVANAGASATTFTCTKPGSVTVTLTVSDGTCSDSATAQLTCSASQVCGNGQLEMGEQCDDGNQQSGDGCSASCVPDDNLSTPGDDRVGYLKCNTSAAPASQMTCTPGQGCCGSQFCAASCGGIDNLLCDGPEDCKNGNACVKGTHGAACGNTSSNNTYVVAIYCHQDADCIGAGQYVPTPSCGPNGLCGP